MKNETLNKPAAKKDDADRAPYESPAIIYEGLITTRAGCRITPGDGSDSPGSADPGKIFSTDG